MKVRVAIIGGTGHYTAEAESLATIPPDAERAAPLEIIRVAGQEVAFVPRHGLRHEWLPHQINYRSNIAALEKLGVTTVIALNAVGGIHPSVTKPGRLVIPHQLIDYTWGRASSFDRAGDLMERHLDFTEPFSDVVRQALIESADSQCVTEGVYGVTQGPRLETAAEIDRLERDGCSIVGMTAMPEAALAAEAAMHYGVLATVVNAAAGRSTVAIDLAMIKRAQEDAQRQVYATIEGAVSRLTSD